MYKDCINSDIALLAPEHHPLWSLGEDKIATRLPGSPLCGFNGPGSDPVGLCRPCHVQLFDIGSRMEKNWVRFEEDKLTG